MSVAFSSSEAQFNFLSWSSQEEICKKMRKPARSKGVTMAHLLRACFCILRKAGLSQRQLAESTGRN